MRIAGWDTRVVAILLLMTSPAAAIPLQQDCRGPGSIGTAMMAADGSRVITLNLHAPDGTGRVAAYKPGDPQYARIMAHLSGIRPGEKKPVAPFC